MAEKLCGLRKKGGKDISVIYGYLSVIGNATQLSITTAPNEIAQSHSKVKISKQAIGGTGAGTVGSLYLFKLKAPNYSDATTEILVSNMQENVWYNYTLANDETLFFLGYNCLNSPIILYKIEFGK